MGEFVYGPEAPQLGTREWIEQESVSDNIILVLELWSGASTVRRNTVYRKYVSGIRLFDRLVLQHTHADLFCNCRDAHDEECDLLDPADVIAGVKKEFRDRCEAWRRGIALSSQEAGHLAGLALVSDDFSRLIQNMESHVGGLVSKLDTIAQKCDSVASRLRVARSAARESAGHIGNRLRYEVMARDRHQCVLCGSRDRLELDHIQPVAAGGKTTKDNLRVLCKRCNAGKGARPLEAKTSPVADA